MTTHIVLWRGVPLTSLARATSIFALVLGWLVLLGWQLDLPILRSTLPGRVAMNPMTALTFMLAAGSLWLQVEPFADRRKLWWAGRAAASLVLLVGLITLVGYVVGQNLGLDQLLFQGRLEGNRIAPNTGLSFLLLGAALLLLDWEIRPGLWPGQFILLIPATIALTSLLGYVYGVGALYGLASYIPMALPTAVTFLVLSLGVLLARPARGLTAVVSADGPGGVLARRLLPAAILVPAFLGWLGLVSERRGLLPTELGLAMMVVLTMLLFAALIWATSRSLNRADLARQAGERRVATQYATTYVLAHAGTLSEALPQILEAIGESLDWSLAVLWNVDAEQKVLRCAETWMAPARRGQALADQSRGMTFPSGVGLPGRIWSSERPAWIVDVQRDPNFPRARARPRMASTARSASPSWDPADSWVSWSFSARRTATLTTLCSRCSTPSGARSASSSNGRWPRSNWSVPSGRRRLPPKPNPNSSPT